MASAPGALRSRSVPVWIHLAQPVAGGGPVGHKAEQGKELHGRSRSCVLVLLLVVIVVYMVVRLVADVAPSITVSTLVAVCAAAGVVHFALLAWACKQPSTRLLLEARRSPTDDSKAPVPALELKPVAAKGDDRLVQVDCKALQRLGSGALSAHFEVAWREQPPGAPRAEAPGSLVALGEQPISVDGWIVPRGQSVELFDGSQISLLTEQEKGRYSVSLIMGARFVTASK